MEYLVAIHQNQLDIDFFYLIYQTNLIIYNNLF